MMSEEKTDARCLVEAAAWRKQLTEDDLQVTPEFEIWLGADPRHQAAWSRVQDMWTSIEEQQASPELLELRRMALVNAQAAARQRWNSTSLDPATDRPTVSIQSLQRKGVGHRLLATVAAAALGALGLLTWYAYSPDMYRTQPGERRVVTLSDGSRVELDSSTELAVQYSKRARDLILSRGQARFDVAHDVERPFAVTAGQQKVVATGTAFNVDMLGANIVVTLIEGRVVVLPQKGSTLGQIFSSPAPGRPAPVADIPFTTATRDSVSHANRDIQLIHGQQVVFSPGANPAVTPANIERATAWQSGQLVFDNEPLASVAERLNRYSSLTRRLVDPRVAELRISGVFNTGDIEGSVDTLTRYLSIDADKENGSVILRPR
jgi:transmembrane sensor